MTSRLSQLLTCYPCVAVMAAVIGCLTTAWLGRRSGLRIGRLMLLLAFVGIGGLLGAKLYGVAIRGGGWHGMAWEMASGLRYPGGILAAFLALWVASARLSRSVHLVKNACAARI